MNIIALNNIFLLSMHLLREAILAYLYLYFK